MTAPYWTDGQVTLYHGDCREVTEWLAADVLVTDPPYGIAYRRQRGTFSIPDDRPIGIRSDKDVKVRDEVLALWPHLAVVFGDLKIDRPLGTRQTLIYQKPPESGTHGTFGMFRHDIEAIYLVGKWPCGLGGRSSVITSGARMVSGQLGMAARYGHPHAKPVDVMETLIAACPPGTIADPFAGAGSTLVAARNQGRAAVGVEIEERYCELAARRLSQADLFGAVTP
jgi:site-specific DNA-methyltransferase (adenine-specific)